MNKNTAICQMCFGKKYSESPERDSERVLILLPKNVEEDF